MRKELKKLWRVLALAMLYGICFAVSWGLSTPALINLGIVTFDNLTFELPQRMEAQIDKQPDNLPLQLLAAELEISKYSHGNTLFPPQEAKAVSLFEKVSSIDPGSPLPHLRLATILIDDAGGLRPEEPEDISAPLRYFSPAPTPEQITRLKRAEKELRLAAARDPENAAAYFLLALARFSLGEKEKAEDALRTLLRKDEWYFYSHEICEAYVSLLEDSYAPPLVVLGKLSGFDGLPQGYRKSWVSGFARFLSRQADEFRLRGDHATATLYYEAALHLGALLIDHGETTLERTFGHHAYLRSARGFITDEERDKIENSQLPRDEKYDQIAAISDRALSDYLIQNNRPARAAKHWKYLKIIEKQDEEDSDILEQELNRLSAALFSPVHAHARISWFFGTITTILIFIAFIASAIFSSITRKDLHYRFSWPLWLVTISVVLIPPHIVLFALRQANLASAANCDFASPDPTAGMLPAYAAARLLLLLLLLVPVVWSFFIGPEDDAPQSRMQKVRRASNAIVSFLYFSGIVFSLIALILSLTSANIIQKAAETQKESVLQGEIKYWQLHRADK